MKFLYEIYSYIFLYEIYYLCPTEAAINESLSVLPLEALFLNSLSFKGKDSFCLLAAIDAG